MSTLKQQLRALETDLEVTTQKLVKKVDALLGIQKKETTEALIALEERLEENSRTFVKQRKRDRTDNEVQH
jgi:phage-related minor tail protein